MRQFLKRRLGSIFAIALTIAIVSPTVVAASVTPRTAYQRAKYTVSVSGGTWNGKDAGHLWGLTTDETVFNVSVTSTTAKTVSADMYKVVPLWFDTEVAHIDDFTGGPGDWTRAAPFYVTDTSSAYYATVTSKDALGAQGWVSVM